MGLFYDRIEKPDRVVIKYSRLIYVYILYAFFLAVGLILRLVLDPILHLVIGVPLVLLCFFLIAIIYFIDLWKPWGEVRKAMKDGKVLVSGSKFSFSNPLTVEILKKASAMEEKSTGKKV